jgi:hypothetical protein
MAALYPTTVKSWTYRVDNTDKVVASDVNSAYDEITSIENQLGTLGVASRTSNPIASQFDSLTLDWTLIGGLRKRLENIENGVQYNSTYVDGGTP